MDYSVFPCALRYGLVQSLWLRERRFIVSAEVILRILRDDLKNKDMKFEILNATRQIL